MDDDASAAPLEASMRHVARFNCRRKQLIEQLLTQLRVLEAPIVPLLEAIRVHYGIAWSLLEESATCALSGHVSTHHRRVQVYAPIHPDPTVPENGTWDVRHDFLPWLRAFYLYYHFGYVVMLRAMHKNPTQHGAQNDQSRTPLPVQRLYQEFRWCERHCQALLKPLAHAYDHYLTVHSA